MDERVRIPDVALGDLGARLTDNGVEFGVASRHAERVFVCLFDCDDRETARIELERRDADTYAGFVPSIGVGQRYGLRTDGPWEPEAGHRFDPDKLLVDPYATRLDRPFAYDPALAAPRGRGGDTARLVPKAIVEIPAMRAPAVPTTAPGLIYEVNVKAHTMRDPLVPHDFRGTLAGLRSPHAIERLVRLGVTHVELMPIAAWVDERHLPPLGLRNAWGYNPVTLMALDPRLAPNGMIDLRDTVSALRSAGIGTMLDVVYNHTGEGDEGGPTLSLRGLDNALYYRHDAKGRLINDAGCGNSLDCSQPVVIRLILDTLRRFVLEAGICGFRFDLATSLGRCAQGFDSAAPLLRAIENDPALGDALLIAEPWDVGLGGYQLGRFGKRWREWNDRYRDDVRRFWRGDAQAAGAFATRLAGSADVFQGPARSPSASVNFLAAHDGFSLRDVVSYSSKQNFANGEHNRDGSPGEISWNNGHEGETHEGDILVRRKRDQRAFLATLFLSRGTPMLTAGDEFSRTQSGNNNAYAQDNEITWLDWAGADVELEAFVCGLARLRAETPALREARFLDGRMQPGMAWPDAAWTRADGAPFSIDDWRSADFLALTLAPVDGDGVRAHLVFNRGDATELILPPTTPGSNWRLALDSARALTGDAAAGATATPCPARSVRLYLETPTPARL